MLEALRSHSNHTIIGIFREGIPAIKRCLKTLVHKIAVSIIVQIAVSAALAWFQPGLFLIGFAIGFALSKQMQALAERVNLVFATKRSLLEKVFLFGGGAFVAAIAFPISFMITTLYFSAQWGALLYQNSLDRYFKQKQQEKEAQAIFV